MTPLIRITQFTRVGEHEFTARVSSDGETIDVEYRDGSWKAVLRDGPRRQSFHRKEVKPFVAEALQEKMPIEFRRRASDLPKSKLNIELVTEGAA